LIIAALVLKKVALVALFIVFGYWLFYWAIMPTQLATKGLFLLPNYHLQLKTVKA
jgi:hypothetical protein